MIYRENDTSQGAGTIFLFEKNMFGDIIAVYNQNGVKQVSYSYDAFGNVTKTIHVQNTNADHNKLYYRGYYYDDETGFYYLNSRYYDPLTCRFINADILLDERSVLGYNLFAYCWNNPVNNIDSTGTMSFGFACPNYTLKCEEQFPNERYNIWKYTVSLAKRTATVAAARVFARFCPEGAAFYLHYLFGGGKDLEFDYGEAISSDRRIQRAVNNCLDSLVDFAKKECTEYNKNYSVYSSQEKIVGNTVNWQFALNAHYIVIHADVMKVGTPPFSTAYHIQYTIYAFDWYTFERGEEFKGMPQSFFGRFSSYVGANSYKSIGTYSGVMIVLK